MGSQIWIDNQHPDRLSGIGERSLYLENQILALVGALTASTSQATLTPSASTAQFKLGEPLDLFADLLGRRCRVVGEAEDHGSIGWRGEDITSA